MRLRAQRQGSPGGVLCGPGELVHLRYTLIGGLHHARYAYPQRGHAACQSQERPHRPREQRGNIQGRLDLLCGVKSHYCGGHGSDCPGRSHYGFSEHRVVVDHGALFPDPLPAVS